MFLLGGGQAVGVEAALKLEKLFLEGAEVERVGSLWGDGVGSEGGEEVVVVLGVDGLAAGCVGWCVCGV